MADEATLPDKDKVSGKWASEAFDFLRMYERVGSQLPGLLLMLIGWAAFLLLVANLSPENAAPAIDLPHWNGGQFSMGTVPLTTVVTVGSLVIVIIWGARSGVYLWLWGPLTYMLRVAGIVITHVVVWGVVVFSELLMQLSRLLLAKPLTREGIDVEFKAPNKFEIDKLGSREVPDALCKAFHHQASDTQEDKGQASKTLVVDLGKGEKFKERRPGESWFVETEGLFYWLQRKEGKAPGKAQLQISAPRWQNRSLAHIQNGVEAGFNAFQDRVYVLYWWLLTRLSGTGRIGLSPLFSYSYAEDALAVKAPMQAYARAISRIHYVLRNSDVERYMLFKPLPAMLCAKSHLQARRMRKWLGFDLLLWGSYVSADPPMMWLNFDHELRKVKQKEREEAKSRGVHEYSFDLDPFGDLNYLGDSAVIVDQRNLPEIYAALTMSLLLSLKARSERPQWLPLPEWLDTRRHTAQKRFLDEAILRCSTDLVDFLRTQLTSSPDVTSSNPQIKQISPTKHLELTVTETFAHFVGDWIGTQLGPDYWRFSWQHRDMPIKEYLDLIDACIQLAPTISQNHFRQAVLQLILAGQITGSNESRTDYSAVEMTRLAEDALKRGQELDSGRHFTKNDRSLLRVMAMDAFTNVVAIRYSEEDTVMVAKAIAYIARATSGDSLDAIQTKEAIQSDFRESIFYSFAKTWESELRQHPVSRVLFEVLALEIPVSQKNEKSQ